MPVGRQTVLLDAVDVLGVGDAVVPGAQGAGAEVAGEEEEEGGTGRRKLDEEEAHLDVRQAVVGGVEERGEAGFAHAEDRPEEEAEEEIAQTAERDVEELPEPEVAAEDPAAEPGEALRE